MLSVTKCVCVCVCVCVCCSLIVSPFIKFKQQNIHRKNSELIFMKVLSLAINRLGNYLNQE